MSESWPEDSGTPLPDGADFKPFQVEVVKMIVSRIMIEGGGWPALEASLSTG